MPSNNKRQLSPNTPRREAAVTINLANIDRAEMYFWGTIRNAVEGLEQLGRIKEVDYTSIQNACNRGVRRRELSRTGQGQGSKSPLKEIQEPVAA